MGNFANIKKISYESITHYTNGPVVLNLNYGPLRYQLIGVGTVYRFLEPGRSGDPQVFSYYLICF